MNGGLYRKSDGGSVLHGKRFGFINDVKLQAVFVVPFDADDPASPVHDLLRMSSEAQGGVDVDAARPRPEQVDDLTTKNRLVLQRALR